LNIGLLELAQMRLYIDYIMQYLNVNILMISLESLVLWNLLLQTLVLFLLRLLLCFG